MNNDRIDRILSNVYPCFDKKETSVNTNNGILNEHFLERQKSLFIKGIIGEWTEYLIDVKQEYPKDDISDIELTADFVIMKRDDFDELKQYINNTDNE